MRLPAYVLLPIFGAVVLTAAVLGSWLWPAPTAPSPSMAPAVLAPVATQTPVPAPAVMPPLTRPATRPMAAKPMPSGAQPQSGAVTLSGPVAAVQPPREMPSPWADMSPEMRGELKQKWSTLRGRAAELAMRGVQELERQREEARARGDQAEFERLDAIVLQQRQRVERMRAIQAELPAQTPDSSSEPPPEQQAGPPLE
jgi:hypothetical protein